MYFNYIAGFEHPNKIILDEEKKLDCWFILLKSSVVLLLPIGVGENKADFSLALPS